MDKVPTILFFNNKPVQCGVKQYGLRIYNIVKQSSKYNFIYIEVSDLEEYLSALKIWENKYACIIYNYCTATMPWLTETTMQLKTRNICIAHEVVMGPANTDAYILSNPFEIPTGNKFPLSRPLPPYVLPVRTEPRKSNPPVIGSYGFGHPSKQIHKIVEYVNNEFDAAIINLNIPFATYGDPDGCWAKAIADRCRSICKPGITLNITHDFLSDEDMVIFLRKNDINLFTYESRPNTGISSALDFAIASGVPFGITLSHMFSHVYVPFIDVDRNSITGIINTGTDYIKTFQNIFSDDKLLYKFEEILNIIVPTSVCLNNNHRRLLSSFIDRMFMHLPDMMGRKIPRANVQQAFIYEYIQRYFKTWHSMLCVGSYEDSANEILKLSGCNITEIDPVLNVDLHTYWEQNKDKRFDVIFSTSVIEHVEKDEEFIADICKLLTPGGTAVLTCDFKPDWKKGDPIFDCNYRFYTKADLEGRIRDVLLNHNCDYVGHTDYDEKPDFEYCGITYTFASFVFKKNLE